MRSPPLAPHPPQIVFQACQSLLRAVLANAHRISGRVWYRLGGVQRARQHFERVLDLRGGDFQAYVFLGRIAYQEGDYLGWHREMEHARLTSPERYARLPRAQALFAPRAAGTLLGEAGARAIWCAPESGGESGHAAPSQHGSAPGEPAGTGSPAPGSRQTFLPLGLEPLPEDDFASREERDRFAILPPISPDEVDGVDLDGLARRLTEG